MTDIEQQVRELQAVIAEKDALILAIAERLTICSALLSRWAERPEFRRVRHTPHNTAALRTASPRPVAGSSPRS